MEPAENGSPEKKIAEEIVRGITDVIGVRNFSLDEVNIVALGLSRIKTYPQNNPSPLKTITASLIWVNGYSWRVPTIMTTSDPKSLSELFSAARKAVYSVSLPFEMHYLKINLAWLYIFAIMFMLEMVLVRRDYRVMGDVMVERLREMEIYAEQSIPKEERKGMTHGQYSSP